jgi:hypothetical protein
LESAACGNEERLIDSLGYVFVGDTDKSVVFCRLLGHWAGGKIRAR